MRKHSKYSTERKFIGDAPFSPAQTAGIFSTKNLTTASTSGASFLERIFSSLLHALFSSRTSSTSTTDGLPDGFKAWQTLKILEGWRDTAYRDVGGVPTIGWGRIEGVKMGDRTTQDKETAWLKDEVQEILDHLHKIIRVPLTQHQIDALVLWAYNVGKGAVSRSTLIKRINQNRLEDVPNQLRRWVHVDGKRVQGLVNRREQEITIWHR